MQPWGCPALSCESCLVVSEGVRASSLLSLQCWTLTPQSACPSLLEASYL